MARYRVGDRYLSQEEYDAERDSKWAAGLFILGALLTGYLIHAFVVDTLWYTWVRIIVTIVPALTAGWILACFRILIARLLAVCLALLALIFIFTLLAEIL